MRPFDRDFVVELSFYRGKLGFDLLNLLGKGYALLVWPKMLASIRLHVSMICCFVHEMTVCLPDPPKEHAFGCERS